MSQHSSGAPPAPAGSAGSYYPTVGQVSTGRPLAGVNGPSAYGGGAAAAPALSGSPIQTFPLLRVQIAELYRTLPPARTHCLSPCCMMPWASFFIAVLAGARASGPAAPLDVSLKFLSFLRCTTVRRSCVIHYAA